MFINNGSVKMEEIDNALRITNLMENKISGIKFKINLKRFNVYTIIISGQKHSELGNIELWITDPTCDILLHTPYKLSQTNQTNQTNQKNIIKFNTSNNDEIYIGILFMDCKVDDYFDLFYMNIVDINNTIILQKNYTTNTIINDDITEYNKNIHNIIEQINTNLLEINDTNAIIPIETIAHDYLNIKEMYNNEMYNNEINNNEINNNQNVILFIVDFVYMKNNLADSRYKFIEYLEKYNNNVFVSGTGRKFFTPNIHINRLVNLLRIRPTIIIHANNFLKTKLLVSGLRDYPCKKILIIEDMHATDLIGGVLRMNRFDYAFYHCDCAQSDRLKLLNKQINFINYPHFYDRDVYKNYHQNKSYDIILYGCITPSVYPFRYRLFNLIRNCKKFKVLYIPFPGYNVPNKNSITHGVRLSKMINKAYIGIVTSSKHQYFLKKYLEIPASFTMIAGDIPPRYKHILKNNIIELYPSMSDAKIIMTLQNALQDKQKLLEDINHLHNVIADNFSFEKGNEIFNQIISSISS